MNKINQQITEYFDTVYRYDCKVKTLYELYGAEEILNTVCELCSMTDANSFGQASIILRDFYLGSDLEEAQKEEYLKAIKDLNILEHVAKYLYSNNFVVRHCAIFTLGKMTQPYIAPRLADACNDFFLSTDPFSCSRAVSELGWLYYDTKDIEQKLAQHREEIFTWICIADFELNLLQKLRKRNFSLSEIRTDLEFKIREKEQDKVLFEGDLPRYLDLENVTYNACQRNCFSEYTGESLVYFIKYYTNNYKQIQSEFKKCGNNQNKFDKLFSSLFMKTFAKFPSLDELRGIPSV